MCGDQPAAKAELTMRQAVHNQKIGPPYQQRYKISPWTKIIDEADAAPRSGVSGLTSICTP